MDQRSPRKFPRIPPGALQGQSLVEKITKMDAQHVISLMFFLCQAIAWTMGENLRWFPPYSSEPEGKPDESSPRKPTFMFFEALEMMVDFLPAGITKVHPKASKVEYSGELGSQNDPKMEPRQQWPILTKHTQA